MTLGTGIHGPTTHGDTTLGTITAGTTIAGTTIAGMTHGTTDTADTGEVIGEHMTLGTTTIIMVTIITHIIVAGTVVGTHTIIM